MKPKVSTSSQSFSSQRSCGNNCNNGWATLKNLIPEKTIPSPQPNHSPLPTGLGQHLNPLSRRWQFVSTCSMLWIYLFACIILCVRYFGSRLKMGAKEWRERLIITHPNHPSGEDAASNKCTHGVGSVERPDLPGAARDISTAWVCRGILFQLVDQWPGQSM